MPEKQTINQKIAKLDEAVEWFYGDDFSLEKASGHYKKAIKLSQEIEQDLRNLKNEIEIIDRDFSEPDDISEDEDDEDDDILPF